MLFVIRVVFSFKRRTAYEMRINDWSSDVCSSDLYMHLRRCEAHYNAGGEGKPSTVYDAIGSAQVAKASFAGMRLLHHLNAHLPIWPFDALPATGLPATGSLIVEIYTSIAARAAKRPKGRTKIRDALTLDAALAEMDTAPHRPLPAYAHHAKTRRASGRGRRGQSGE